MIILLLQSCKFIILNIDKRKRRCSNTVLHTYKATYAYMGYLRTSPPKVNTYQAYSPKSALAILMITVIDNIDLTSTKSQRSTGLQTEKLLGYLDDDLDSPHTAHLLKTLTTLIHQTVS